MLIIFDKVFTCPKFLSLFHKPLLPREANPSSTNYFNYPTTRSTDSYYKKSLKLTVKGKNTMTGTISTMIISRNGSARTGGTLAVKLEHFIYDSE